MSSRERWTIYPLLFLALGASLRSKLTNSSDIGVINSRLVKSTQVAAGRVQCDDLVVVGRIAIVGPDGKLRLQMGSTRDETGLLEVYGRGGRPVAKLAADPVTSSGVLNLQTTDGAPQVSARSGPHGGVVTTIDPERAILVELGATATEAGVIVNDALGRVVPRRQLQPHENRIPSLPRD